MRTSEQGDETVRFTVKETMAYAMALCRGIYATEETNDRSYEEGSPISTIKLLVRLRWHTKPETPGIS